MRRINKLIVHCSATPEGRDVKTETIKDWHVNGNRWKDIVRYSVVIVLGSIINYFIFKQIEIKDIIQYE